MEVKKADPDKPVPPRPVINHDTRFFWEGLKNGKLLIQQCSDCNELRHPPSPMCPKCRSLNWDTVESSGKGFIYSFVVMHHPELPAFDNPNPIGLIELEEGTRIVGKLTGIAPENLRVGIPVQAEITKYDDDLTLAFFRPDENS